MQKVKALIAQYPGLMTLCTPWFIHRSYLVMTITGR